MKLTATLTDSTLVLRLVPETDHERRLCDVLHGYKGTPTVKAEEDRNRVHYQVPQVNALTITIPKDAPSDD